MIVQNIYADDVSLLHREPKIVESSDRNDHLHARIHMSSKREFVFYQPSSYFNFQQRSSKTRFFDARVQETCKFDRKIRFKMGNCFQSASSEVSLSGISRKVSVRSKR